MKIEIEHIKKKWSKVTSVFSLATSSSVWLMRKICSLTAVTHHAKTAFFFIFLAAGQNILRRNEWTTSGRGGKKKRHMVFLECGRHRRRCRVAVIFFLFFFYIRPSARDYSPQWLWITCRGLARSPVTKSFWRITPPAPHRHSTTAFFLFFVFFVSCFARYGFKSVWWPRWHWWAKNKSGRAHVTICD